MLIMKTKEENTSTNNNATNNNVHVLGPWEETGICSKKARRQKENMSHTTFSPLNCSRGGKMKGTFFEIFKLRTKPKTHYLFQWTSNLVELSAVHRLFKGFKGSRISFRPQSDRSV